MDDLISRQAAIDELSQRHIIMDNPHYIGYNAGLDEAQKVIKALPPVQTEILASGEGELNVPDTNVGDMISRQAAIDALDCINGVEEVLRSLPAVQPAIIHCKNCEHWDTSWETAYGLHYCPMIDMATKKNFFCKYGAEKRGDTE